MTEYGSPGDPKSGKGRNGVYVLLILVTLVAGALITVDAVVDDTAEVTDQLDPTTIEDVHR